MEKRGTFIEVFKSASDFIHIIASPFCETNSYVITLDCRTGNPFYLGVPMVDTFPDNSLALQYIKDNFDSQRIAKGEGLLGIHESKNFVVIGIIESSEVSGWMPGGHLIRIVKNINYIKIPIKGTKMSEIPAVCDFQLTNNHYFCETYDLTRLFPSNKPAYEPDEDFCWNNFWRKPFKAFGLEFCCVTLLQGLAQSFQPPKSDYTLTHICRRSSSNPGTRYAARGLNERGYPGNEVEAELIFVRGDHFSSARWRRGSIPIHWKTILNTKVSTPQHIVETEKFFEGTKEYFSKLKERYEVEDIHCISLLQTNNSQSEMQLHEYFSKAVDKLYHVGCTGVNFMPFDLNFRLHEDGSGEAMYDFLSFLIPMVEENRYTEGKLPDTITHKQENLLRFNCADSLDRTNLATFFFSMYVCSRWFVKEGIVPDKDNAEALPNTILPQEVIDFLAKTFVESGNIVSTLSTNTPAIKVNAIKKFSPTLEQSANDTSITLQRRFQNVVNDQKRQTVIELWTKDNELGMSHRLSSSYINVINDVSPEIIGSGEAAFKLAGKEVVVGFQKPVLLKSVQMLLIPTEDSPIEFKLESGMRVSTMDYVCTLALPFVEKPTWCRYDIDSMHKMGLEDPEKRFVQFLKLTFVSETSEVVIGNMKFDVIYDQNNTPIEATKKFAEPDEQNLERLNQSISEFNSSNKGLNEAIHLESTRISLKIPEKWKVTFMQNIDVNPWISDSYSLINTAKTDECCFCHHKFVENEDRFTFYQSKRLRGLLNAEKDENSSKEVFVCQNCRELASGSAVPTKIYEKDLLTRIVPPKSQKKVNFPLKEINRFKNISCSSQSIFIDGDDKAYSLYVGDETVHLSKDEQITMKLKFRFSAFVTLISLIGSSTNMVVTLNGKETSLNEDYFEILEPTLSEEITVTIKANEDIDITEFGVYGTLIILTERDSSMLKISSFPPKVLGVETPLVLRVDPSKRTEEAKQFFRKKVKTIVFERRQGEKMAYSIVVSLKIKMKVVWRKHIIIPQHTGITKFAYPVDCKQAIDTIELFYLDRCSSFRSPNVYIL